MSVTAPDLWRIRIRSSNGECDRERDVIAGRPKIFYLDPGTYQITDLGSPMGPLDATGQTQTIVLEAGATSTVELRPARQ